MLDQIFERGFQTRCHAPCHVQEAKTKLNTSILHSWKEAGLLVHANNEFYFSGWSPYVPLHADVDDPTQMVHIPSYIAASDIPRMPLQHYPLRPLLVRSPQDAERAVSTMLKLADSANPADRVLGFDLEWKPNRAPPQNPPAVVQVSLLHVCSILLPMM